MEGLYVILFIIVIASADMCVGVRLDASPTFNVIDYGAKGDGKTDDSQAFVKAWKDVCGETQDTATLVIPRGRTFMLQPVSFHGPCKPSTINIEFQGTIIAPKSVEVWKISNDNNKIWILFSNINGLVINGRGGGKIDGEGASWWHSNSDISNRPTALQFHQCENLRISTLTHINSPRNHISIDGCKDSTFSNLLIIAPEDSPNTDGIDIAESTNITIHQSTIKTGDDCIAINSGSSFINITNVLCGPGHGISVGSLGRNGAFASVEEIYVRNCTFHGTTNGARIKTWKGGSGYARKITFEDIVLVGVTNPLIINQQYSNLYLETTNELEAVKISDITYLNVNGTSKGEAAILLNCDHEVGCVNIVLNNIRITLEDGHPANASCTNAYGSCSSCNPIVSCLK
ncbi:hypothetical protein VNO77_23629 [Canavalia gladiata]|uniref:Polygalacturonase n=1 Tax=Canavalia gladiata TaxID=3824 RepID=A0AAN9L4R6_CANGL